MTIRRKISLAINAIALGFIGFSFYLFWIAAGLEMRPFMLPTEAFRAILCFGTSLTLAVISYWVRHDSFY